MVHCLSCPQFRPDLSKCFLRPTYQRWQKSRFRENSVLINIHNNCNELHLMKFHMNSKNCLALNSTTVNTLPSLQNSVKSIRTGTPSSKSSSGLPSMSFPFPVSGPLPLFDEFFRCSSSTR